MNSLQEEVRQKQHSLADNYELVNEYKAQLNDQRQNHKMQLQQKQEIIAASARELKRVKLKLYSYEGLKSTPAQLTAENTFKEEKIHTYGQIKDLAQEMEILRKKK